MILLRFNAVLSLDIIFLPRESHPDSCYDECLSTCANTVVIRGFHRARRRHTATTVDLPFPRASRPCSSPPRSSIHTATLPRMADSLTKNHHRWVLTRIRCVLSKPNPHQRHGTPRLAHHVCVLSDPTTKILDRSTQ